MFNIGNVLGSVANALSNTAKSDDGTQSSEARFTGALPTGVTATREGWLANVLAQTQEQTRTPPPVTYINGLPNPIERTTAEKYDFFVDEAERRGYAVDKADGHRTIIGFRVSTNTAEASTATTAGTSRYDDLFVVVWQDKDKNGDTVKHVSQFIANTEPSAQYDEVLAGSKKSDGTVIADRGKGHYQGGDPNGDGKLDLGRLPDGMYKYERSSSANLGAIGTRILRPVTDKGFIMERDVNHDGRFDNADREGIAEYKARLIMSGKTELDAQKIIDKELNSGTTVYLHQGGAVTRNKSGNVTAQNTYSAACQTFPGATEFDRFWNSLGDAKVTGQKTLDYVLITTTQQH